MEALIDWVLNLKPEELPPVPWRLSACSTVTDNQVFLTSLKRDLLKGPDHPRARFGTIQQTVILIWNIKNA